MDLIQSEEGLSDIGLSGSGVIFGRTRLLCKVGQPGIYLVAPARLFPGSQPLSSYVGITV